MDNPQGCTAYPLWNANYGVTPSLTPRAPYGGWDTSVGHQYQDTTSIDGVDVDVSLFDGVWVQGAPVDDGEVAALHARWAEAAALRAQADALNGQAGDIEAEVIARKVALGLQPA